MGSPSADAPERYGPHTTCYNRFVRWRKAGVWSYILEEISKAFDGDVVMIDSSCVRVHQMPPRKKGGLDDRCMGRPRGGLTTKIHALVDAEGRPGALTLTAGQTHDNVLAEPMLADLKPGANLLADKAYDTTALRALADSKRAWANIPAKRTRKETFAFSSWVYRQRNLVERFFNKLKQMRGIATYYDKDPLNFLAAIELIAARIRIKASSLYDLNRPAPMRYFQWPARHAVARGPAPIPPALQSSAAPRS